jgi:hypothetical protein
VAETADLKSLARRVLARDTDRDAAADGAFNVHVELRQSVRQISASVSESELRAPTPFSNSLADAVGNRPSKTASAFLLNGETKLTRSAGRRETCSALACFLTGRRRTNDD